MLIDIIAVTVDTMAADTSAEATDIVAAVGIAAITVGIVVATLGTTAVVGTMAPHCPCWGAEFSCLVDRSSFLFNLI